MRSAAFFDLDKTLIARSTALAFARPLYRARLLRRRDITRSARAQLSFISARADHALMERIREQMSATVTGWQVEGLRTVIAEHLGPVLSPLLYREAAALIEEHRDADRLLVLVTTTGNDMAEPVGVFLGLDRVLSTRMVERDGRYTGDIADYMYGERKAAAIRELAEAEEIDLSRSYAYSDSITDLPMLRSVGHPHAVNPDHALRATAAELGWPILDFTDAGVRRPTTPLKLILMAGLVVVAVGAVWVLGRRLRTHRRNNPTISGSSCLQGLSKL